MKGNVASRRVLVTALAVLLRCLIGLHTHSGEHDPPMHGDFEAQRHWMELTRFKDVSEWYKYDVLYWGLDYPPLSAYHALLTSYGIGAVDPAAIALDSSRGHEGAEARAAMRFSVVIWDLLVLIPAAWFFAICHEGNEWRRVLIFWAITCSPPLLLIDHGHFQYNGVFLGLLVLAVGCVLRGQDVLGAAFFALSFNFKHMSLYFAPAFASYALGRTKAAGVAYLLRLCLSALLTTAVLWSPFDAGVVFRRLFPIERGLYEDKVANLWCAVSPLIKLQRLGSKSGLFKLAAAATLLAVLPSCIALYRRPSHSRLLLGLCTSSLSCFLFAYQVHEKQILLPQVAVAMASVSACDSMAYFSLVATFSLFPLMSRETLTLAYSALLLLHIYFLELLGASRALFSAVTAVMLGSHLLWAFGPSFSSLPDLYPLIFSALSCGALLLLLVSLNRKLWVCEG
mmetsp:Transcript_1197/g.3691  ORF Transcript_1197/g.3691 Transcript_1197/m.3691 type:complete len:454 (-) Transcript_1197:1001-2362(-)